MMKILFEILVILLTVFLNSVELGTPLGSGFPLRPGAAPIPNRAQAPSRSRKAERGGRAARIQSGRTNQPTAAPSTPEPTGERKLEEIIYIEDPRRGFLKIVDATEQDLDVHLVTYYNFIIGRVEGEDILPIFDKDHKMIKIDYTENNLPVTMGKTTARNYGVFGTYADFCKKHPQAVFF